MQAEAGEPDAVPRGGDGEDPPGKHCQARKDKKVMGSGRRGFTKGKWCLTGLRVSYVEGTSPVDEERAASGVYFSFLVKPLTLSLLAWS